MKNMPDKRARSFRGGQNSNTLLGVVSWPRRINPLMFGGGLREAPCKGQTTPK